ncbi:MAG: carboxypeptidase-like regulatory domain-containing protein [Acidobacteriota bacterium]
MRRSIPISLRIILVCLLVSGLGVQPFTAQDKKPGGIMVSLSGRIFRPDGTTPYDGAVIKIINEETGQVFTSEPTGVTGEYQFTDLPAGTYTFQVDVPEGVYKLGRAVRIGESETASISFTVKPEPVKKGAALPASGKKSLTRGQLALIIIGGAVVVGAAAGGGGGGSQVISPMGPNPPGP